MKNTDRLIEQVTIENLTPYEKNSKIHTKLQIQFMSLGFMIRLLLRDRIIVLEGTGRIEAAKLLGLNPLPCIRLDHLNESEQRAYVIAHNSLSLETGFDDAVLMREPNELL